MGRYSFSAPGSRYGLKPWFRVGNFDVTTSVLVAGLAVISLFVWSLDRPTIARLWLWPPAVRDGEVWRIVTWPFANQPTLWTVLGIAIFWYFGSEIEGRVGRNRFAFLIAAVIILPGVLATLVDVDQAGLRPVQFAVLLLFIAEYPSARFFFGIPAWILGAVFLGLEVLVLVGDRQQDRLLVLAASLGTAGIVGRSYGLLQNFQWLPALPLPGADGRTHRRPKRQKRSSGPRVVEGPWGSAQRRGPMPVPPPDPAAASDQAELDALLDKINENGIDGLTSTEKRRLNELSKRLREG